ncbi:variable large family protein [Borrelia persica]|uniref:variable large family protein n=1 Tax=Borrelia persica TaxID=44448 RepID=UPI001F295F30|nr:variable large family protein [Borrelia persica]
MNNIFKRSLIIMMILGVMGCNSGLVSEKERLEKKNSFLDSLVKIGQGFQEIFGVFGNVVGDVLGFNVVKPEDNRSKVGEHFKKIGDGLTTTKNKLDELSSKISEAKNAEEGTIKVVEDAIKGASDIFEQLIAALTKLASAAGSTEIGHNSTGAAVAADKDSVTAVIESVNAIIEVAKKSEVGIKPGNAGGNVAAGAQANAPAVLGGTASQGAGDKLVAEVLKADPWAMIDKIKNAKADNAQLAGNNKDAGALAVGTASADNNGAGAATNADLAAAVALKAITRSGKFSVAAQDTEAVKGAAVSAVNKVLGILDLIIRKTVSSKLDKVRGAIKGIQYFEITGTDANEAGTTQSTAIK